MKPNNTLIKEINTSENTGCSCSILKVTSLPLHMHHAYEIILVLKGSVELTCTSFKYHLSKGDVFINNVNELHSIHKTNEENLLLIFHFDPYEYSNTFPHLSYYWFFCESYSIKEKDNKTLKLFQTILLKAAHMLNSVNKSNAETINHIRTLTSDIINFMINNFQNVSFHEKTSIKKNFKAGDELAMKRIFEIQEYIYLNFMQKVSLDDISSHLCLNKYYVSRLIKNFIGLNLTDLLGLIRTEKAEIKLLSTNMSIEQIAFECGFSSVSYFEKHFIKWNKMKPSQYRKVKLEEISHEFESFTVVDIDNQWFCQSEYELLSIPINKSTPLNDHYISVDMDSNGQNFTHFWERHINISNISAAIQLFNKISFNECKKDLMFNTVRILNIFDSFPHISTSNSFFKSGLLSFFNTLIENNIGIEFYFLPPANQFNEISKPLSAFIEFLSSFYEDFNNGYFSFTVNTAYLQSKKDALIFSEAFKKLLLQYNINKLCIVSQNLQTELYAYDSMQLVPEIITSSVDINDHLYYCNYRELFDLPNKALNANASFSKNGLLGSFGEKKPLYHAYNLLSLLGDQLLLKNDGILVTKKRDDYYILIFDTSNTRLLTKNPYLSSVQFRLNFKTSYKHTYNLIELSLDADFSLFRQLKVLGFPQELTPKDVKYLNKYTSPRINMSCFTPYESNNLNININPYSAKLLILEKRKI